MKRLVLILTFLALLIPSAATATAPIQAVNEDGGGRSCSVYNAGAVIEVGGFMMWGFWWQVLLSCDDDNNNGNYYWKQYYCYNGYCFRS